MFPRPLLLLTMLGLLSVPLSSAQAGKKDEEGVPVTVKVIDEAGAPVPTAVVRHPDEADRHRVNSITGEWTAPILYLPDGGDLVFIPGMTIRLEVSAPGYMTQIIQYDIRKRRNKLEVSLAQLVMDDDSVEEPLIQFGRDKPREVGGSGPAN